MWVLGKRNSRPPSSGRSLLSRTNSKGRYITIETWVHVWCLFHPISYNVLGGSGQTMIEKPLLFGNGFECQVLGIGWSKLAISRILFLSFHLQVVPRVRAMDFGYVVTRILVGPRSKDVRRSECQILAWNHLGWWPRKSQLEGESGTGVMSRLPWTRMRTLINTEGGQSM